MRSIRALIAWTVVILVTTAGLVVAPSPASAATHGCYGAGCNNLAPDNRCNGDAITVRAMAVRDGMLELRYSPSCKANWGRYSPYWRTAATHAVHGSGIHARVTVWNPGHQSYGPAHMADPNPFASSWSKMTDGTKVACTGVELTFISGSDTQNYGWTWGPCY